MKQFYKYQHIESKFNIAKTQGLLFGDMMITPKIDGSNCLIWSENGEIKISSRTRILSYDEDNRNCYKTLINDKRLITFFADYPDIKLCGEWLVQHKIRYIDSAYNKLYVYDAIYLSSEEDNGKCDYMDYSKLFEILKKYELDCVPYHYINYKELEEAIVNIKKRDEFFRKYHWLSGYLVSSKEYEQSQNVIPTIGECEGVIVKNYNYKNRYGRSTWVKLINTSWYKIKTVKPKVVIDKSAEIAFIEDNLNEHLLSKCYYKIDNFDSKKIGEYIKLCQAEFCEDFITNEDFNIKIINNLIATKARDYLISIGEL